MTTSNLNLKAFSKSLSFGFILIINLTLFITNNSYAKEFFVNPDSNLSNAIGTKELPWKSLKKLVTQSFIETQRWNKLPYNNDSSHLVVKNHGAQIKGGDTIYLMSGNYGNLNIESYYNSLPIVIKAYPGHTPVFDSISIRSSSNWTFDGVTILRPERSKKRVLFNASGHIYSGPAFDIVIQNSIIKSGASTKEWSAKDWNSAAKGIQTDADNFIAKNNLIENIGFGVDVYGDHSLVESNTINRFSYDAIRGLGNYSTYQYNLIKNCVQTGNNAHDDGFQSWSRGGKPVVGMIINSNTILEFDDPDLPFSSMQPKTGGRGLQGIGLFDGFYEDLVIQNNVIVVNQWHGITVNGFKDCKIVNNTVFDPNFKRPGPPWIMIDNHKSGKLSHGCLVRNNLGTGIKIKARAGVKVDHNFISKALNPMFKDVFKNDLRLKSGALAIDAGTCVGVPKWDRAGNIRGVDSSCDIGAYEFIER